MFDFSNFNLSKCNISCKIKKKKKKRKTYLCIFGLELEKATVLWYFTSAHSIFFKHKISTKN